MSNQIATTSRLLTLPNELLLTLGEHLPPNSLYSLTLTSRRLAILLLPRLHTLACSDDFSITALFWAAASENTTLATRILQKTKSAFRVLPAAATAVSIHDAPGECNPSALKFVLSARAELVLHYKCITYTSIFWAVVSGHKPLATLLLTATPSNINSLNACGRSALHEAVYRGDYAMVSLILSSKAAAVNTPDSQGNGPLYWAVVVREDVTMASILLKHGANPASYTDPLSGRKLLHLAALRPGASGMVRALLSHGADPTSRTFMGQSPLHFAAKHADASTVGTLLENPKCSTNINTRDMLGWSPLHLAAKAGLDEVVAVLLEHGAEVNARDDYGSTPLHRAVWHGRERVVGMLVERGADLNMPDDSGKTGFDLAMIRMRVRETGRASAGSGGDDRL